MKELPVIGYSCLRKKTILERGKRFFAVVVYEQIYLGNVDKWNV